MFITHSLEWGGNNTNNTTIKHQLVWNKLLAPSLTQTCPVLFKARERENLAGWALTTHHTPHRTAVCTTHTHTHTR